MMANTRRPAGPAVVFAALLGHLTVGAQVAGAQDAQNHAGGRADDATPSQTWSASPAMSSRVRRALEALFPPASLVTTDGSPEDESQAFAAPARPTGDPSAWSVSDAPPTTAGPPADLGQPEAETRSGIGQPRVYGFVQTHFRAARDTSGDGVVDASDFRVQRVRIGVRGDLRPWLRYEIEIDPRAPEITGVLRDAFFVVRAIPRHQIRVGQQKTQFGYENRESSSDLVVVNRAEVSDALSRGINLRDIGVGIVGNIPLGPRWRFEDAITVVNGAGINVQADNTPKKNVWGRGGLRYRSSTGATTVSVGASAGSGDLTEIVQDPTASHEELIEFTRQGFDVQLDHRLGFASAEYVRGADDNLTLGESDDRKGYYVQLGVKTRWEAGPLLRLDTLDDDFRRWTYGAYYGRPNRPFRVLVNFERRAMRDGSRADDKFYVWAQVRF